MQISRGDIVRVDLSGIVGSEQGGLRPCIIVSNEMCNKNSTAVTIVPLTKQYKTNIPTHIEIGKKYVVEDSLILVEQVRCVSIDRISRKFGRVGPEIIEQINDKLEIQLALNEVKYDYLYSLLDMIIDIKRNYPASPSLPKLSKMYDEYVRKYKLDSDIVKESYKRRKV